MSLLKRMSILIGMILIMVTLMQCVSSETPAETPNYVIIHQSAEPKSLNPTNSRGAEATVIYYGIVQELLNADFEKMEIVPVLAKERPAFNKIAGSNLMEMAFEIREEAVWDNGTPITGEDVAFSLKTIKVPQTDCGHKKPYFEYIKDIIIDKENPKKFKFITEQYFLAENVMSDLHILPSYVYDKNNVLKDYTIADLSDTNKTKVFEADAKLIEFAKTFNSNELQRVVYGSGPYEFMTWKANERIILRRKDNWWGDKVKNTKNNPWLEAYPDTVIYEIIPDKATAFAALKSGRVNTMSSILPRIYKQECQKPEFQAKFHIGQPERFSYEFIGFNHARPIFQDVKTRQAMSYLVNVQQLVKTAYEGFGTATASFSHPANPKFLAEDVKPYEYSIDKAKALLKEAGWEDKDGDGILEREIDGVLTPFRVTIMANKENDGRMKVCEMLADAGREVGIKIDVETLVWTSYLSKMMKRNFDMFTLGWGSSPFESDPKQIWHSESIKKGSNYINYDNPELDKLIDEMRTIVVEADRLPYYHKMHKIIHDDAPIIFTVTQKELIAVSKMFDNVYFTGMKPGFWSSGFTVGELTR